MQLNHILPYSIWSKKQQPGCRQMLQVLVSLDEAAVAANTHLPLVRVLFDFRPQSPYELRLRKVISQFSCNFDTHELPLHVCRPTLLKVVHTLYNAKNANFSLPFPIYTVIFQFYLSLKLYKTKQPITLPRYFLPPWDPTCYKNLSIYAT